MDGENNQAMPYVISAVGTPLNNDERLNHDEFRRHLEEQWHYGLDGVLVGGTMGAMQLLADRTYEELVEAAAFAEPSGEMLVGVGDSSYARTKDRITRLNRYRVDGAVVLCPFVFEFSQEEIVRYMLDLADYSINPLYLYHLPLLTRTPLEVETVLSLAQHPNILGMKAAGPIDETREMLRSVPAEFRIFVAEAPSLVKLLRENVRYHVDGIFSLAPSWVGEVCRAAQRGDWERANAYQTRVTKLLEAISRYPIFSAFSTVLKALGYTSSFAPRPFRVLTAEEQADLLRDSVVIQLLEERRDEQEIVGAVKRRA